MAARRGGNAAMRSVPEGQTDDELNVEYTRIASLATAENALTDLMERRFS